jgi:hypothetical protein
MPFPKSRASAGTFTEQGGYSMIRERGALCVPDDMITIMLMGFALCEKSKQGGCCFGWVGALSGGDIQISFALCIELFTAMRFRCCRKNSGFNQVGV